MRRGLREETIIFISVFKWLILASVIGAIVGLSTALFLHVLNWGMGVAGRFRYYFIFLPLALVLSTVIIRRLAPEAEGHGTEKVIEAVHKRSGRIKAMVVPVKLVATVITLAFGGSAGKEGPCAQIGAGLSSVFADIFKFEDIDRKKLVICGISGGFAAVFGTPIAGAIFGIEVLFVGSILYDVLLPSFVAGIISYQVTSALGIKYFYHHINYVPVFTQSFFIKVVLGGMFFGICSFILVEIMRLGKSVSERVGLPPYRQALLGGVVLVVLSLVFSDRFLGLGISGIHSALGGEPVPWYDFIMKSIFTSITLNFGGSGGIVTPIFFIGATSGNLYGHMVESDIVIFSAIGLVSLLAGSANTPIAASIMAVELFGSNIAPYAAIACVISFIMSGHRSVYPSQILAMKKSASIEVEIGKEMEYVSPKYRYRDRSFTGAMQNLITVLKKIGKKKDEG